MQLELKLIKEKQENELKILEEKHKQNLELIKEKKLLLQEQQNIMLLQQQSTNISIPMLTCSLKEIKTIPEDERKEKYTLCEIKNLENDYDMSFIEKDYYQCSKHGHYTLKSNFTLIRGKPKSTCDLCEKTKEDRIQVEINTANNDPNLLYCSRCKKTHNKLEFSLDRKGNYYKQCDKQRLGRRYDICHYILYDLMHYSQHLLYHYNKSISINNYIYYMFFLILI